MYSNYMWLNIPSAFGSHVIDIPSTTPFFLSFCSAEDWIQGHMCAWQALYHWAIPTVPLTFSFWDGVSLSDPGYSRALALKWFSHLSLLNNWDSRHEPPSLTPSLKMSLSEGQRKMLSVFTYINIHMVYLYGI